MTDNQEQETSWHAATEPEKCLEMERKYGWKLLRIKRIEGKTFKVICVFQGKTEFPNHQQD